MERPIEHDDLLGEPISGDELYEVQQQVMRFMYQVLKAYHRRPDVPTVSTCACLPVSAACSSTCVSCFVERAGPRAAALSGISACVFGEVKLGHAAAAPLLGDVEG